jgi:alkanesulfonate monooxygenase SsuD/methylene tetrahydromethanopterin reductase-like flavin-dependent oxidoreductase (luciferase family)
MHNANTLKLGLFSPNCSGGMAVTKVPERWDASWDNNVALARMADGYGFEFLLPIARWRGYGGDVNFQGNTLETMTWSAGLLAATEAITVFCTAHTSFHHPLVAAKMLSTIDQIGHGRLGLNVVCGWNQPEYEMFGKHLPDSHDERYAFGQEWFDVITKTWNTHEEFDWRGTFFELNYVASDPKPYNGIMPPIMNAGASPQGQAFAARNCDYLFTTMIEPEQSAPIVAGVKEQARGFGRDMGVMTNCYVVCRPTMTEAEDYHHYYAIEMQDEEGTSRLMELQGLHAQSFPAEAFALFRERFAAGHGVYPLVGTPDHIADELAPISTAGFDGTTVTFVNYLDELPYFAEEVLPRLVAKGLRVAP